MSRRKLAITLGVKSSSNNWVLLTDASCCPNSEHWISMLASNCNSSTDPVMGYCRYSDDTSMFISFNHLRLCYIMMLEAANGSAYASCGYNLMFRKKIFMDGDGFRGSLKYIGGESDFLVNKYSNSTNTALDIREDCCMIQDCSSADKYQARRILYMETRRHLRGNFHHRKYYNTDSWSLHLCFWFALCSSAYSLLSLNWVVLSISAISFILPLLIRLLNAKRVIKQLNAHVALYKVIPYEFFSVFDNFRYILKYKFSNKSDFISHKS